jgi:hypothetical protein
VREEQQNADERGSKQMNANTPTTFGCFDVARKYQATYKQNQGFAVSAFICGNPRSSAFSSFFAH